MYITASGEELALVQSHYLLLNAYMYHMYGTSISYSTKLWQRKHTEGNQGKTKIFVITCQSAKVIYRQNFVLCVG